MLISSFDSVKMFEYILFKRVLTKGTLWMQCTQCVLHTGYLISTETLCQRESIPQSEKEKYNGTALRAVK